MENDIINTLQDYERVTSTYADIYLNNDYCRSKLLINDNNSKHELEQSQDDEHQRDVEWISPSDLLIGKVELNPPFTSKITRGKTHEGILAIGNEVLDEEYKRFLTSLNNMLHENDESWNYILINEKKQIAIKVEEMFKNIFANKSKIMYEELVKFYENSLQDLEEHLQSEVQNVLKSVHASMISNLNIDITSKLEKERAVLERDLKKKYKEETYKIITYYNLLLGNEEYKNNKIINSALKDRNEALKAFCRQIDAERLTTSMYVMSIERKKCKIKKMLLENFQNTELSEKLAKIKERQDIIEAFQQKEQKISDINKQWEEKMQKVLELFLKFISFSLKLLPEQSIFLLDFQKMVYLQLNEMQKHPQPECVTKSILIDEDDLTNIFQFESPDMGEQVCQLKPFTVVGDLSDPIPPRYGSSETLPSNVDLPFIRLNRQYMYAKCHGYEDLKKVLESQKCKCTQKPSPTDTQKSSNSPEKIKITDITPESSLSAETVFINDINRLQECPNRKCQHWTEKNLFPFLPSYFDYNDKNFERVKAILGKTPSKEKAPELISERTIACSEIPFAETKEKCRNAETQYSIHELEITNINCTCMDNYSIHIKNTDSEIKRPSFTDVLTKRKVSLRRLLEQNSKLKFFTDENFDFQL